MGYKTVAEIFSQISGLYDKFLNFVSAGRIHAWQRELISLMGSGRNILDVGTGTGEVLLKARERFNGILVGLDPSEGMLRIARRKCSECYFLQGLGEDMPFKEGVFDAITLSLVFRHLEDQRRLLRDSARILKVGGEIGILDVSRIRGTGAVLFMMRTLLKPAGLLIFGRDKWEFFIHSIENSHTAEEVSRMLKEAGFGVKEVRKKLFGFIHIIVGSKTA